MSVVEKEFTRWLNNESKSFKENLSFAIKALKSSELTLLNKYEIVLKWISEQVDIQVEDISKGDLHQLFSLRIQLNSISQQVKSDFVEWFLKISKHYFNENSAIKREWPELLKTLLEFELMQDLYRFNYKLMAQLYACTFKCYGYYLEKLLNSHSEEKFVVITQETKFFQPLLSVLKNTIKHIGDVNMYEKSFTEYVLQPLAEVILQFQKHSLNFLEELVDIERLLTIDLSDHELIERILKQSGATRLISLECALINRKFSENFMQYMIIQVFDKVNSNNSSSALDLLMLASVLELFNQHNINLNIEINNEQTALKYLSLTLTTCIKRNLLDHFQEIILLLCFILQFNPLILEQSIFEITATIILLPKSPNVTHEMELFERYLIVFINMFGHIYKAEKCVTNLLKALGKQLENVNALKKFADTLTSKKRKSNQLTIEKESPTCKKRKSASKESMQLSLMNDTSSIPTNADEHILFQKLYRTILNSKTINSVIPGQDCVISQSFTKLKMHWPSNSAGVTFSKLISTLLSRPSISIWKTLLYTLQGLLNAVIDKTEIEYELFRDNEYELFYLDFHCALLSQYFSGCKLIEKCENNLDAVQTNLDFTHNILKLFGKLLLQHEHNARLMTAFLDLSYYFTSFYITLAFYKASSFSISNETIHTFLNAQQWILIEQRVLNFGKTQCKYLLQRLQMQRKQVEYTFNGENSLNIIQLNAAIDKILKDPDQLHAILKKSPSNAEWLIKKCERSTKKSIAKFITKNWNPNLLSLSHLCEDEDLTLFMALFIYKGLRRNMSINNSYIKDLLTSAETIVMEQVPNEVFMKTLIENSLVYFMADYLNHTEADVKRSALNLEEMEMLEKLLDALSQLSIGRLKRDIKVVFFIVHLLIYFILKSNYHQENLSQKAFRIIQDFLHFGQRMLVFHYVPAHQFFNIFPINNYRDLYELLFDFLSKSEETENLESFFNEINNRLTKNSLSLSSASTNTAQTLTTDELYLLVMSIKTLYSMERHMKRYKNTLQEFLSMLERYVQMHFKVNDVSFPSEENNNNSGNSNSNNNIYSSDNPNFSNSFMQETLSAMPIYVSSIFNTKERISDEIRRIIKVYLGISINNFNAYSINLIQLALNHRDQLQLDYNEIEFILTNCWNKLKIEYLLATEENLDHQESLYESAIKVITSNKTNEDFILLLRNIYIELNENVKYTNRVLYLLTSIAKCIFSTIKGAIFNDQYKLITNHITLHLMNKINFKEEEKEKNKIEETRERQLSSIHYNNLVILLQCHLAFINNKTIIMTTDSLDTILILLTDINLKKFRLQRGDNLKQFHSLYTASVDVLTALIKHYVSLERISQYTLIFKDLMQAIMLWWYTDDSNQYKIILTTNEMDMLFILYFKLENLVHMMAQHSIHFKRVAPFVLISIINLFVLNTNPAMHHNKIKRHIENICQGLIKICDHRSGHFILRCLNEAGRTFYETLAADYHKKYKFRGKV